MYSKSLKVISILKKSSLFLESFSELNMSKLHFVIGRHYQHRNKYDHETAVHLVFNLNLRCLATLVMDLKTLLHNLHEEVSCSVCQETFTDPKVLPCLHSFCLHCLNELQRTSGRVGQISCPECRGEFGIAGSGTPDQLPTNFRLNSLLDVLAIQECNSAGVKCGNCDKRSAQCFYCFQCCVFWCEDCLLGHNIIRANREHRVLALKDFQHQDIEDVIKRPAFCQKEHHGNEELKFFCKDCKVPICNTCVVTLHDGHAKVPLAQAANKRKQREKSVIESRKQEAVQKRSKLSKIQDERTKIQTQAASVKQNAQIFADNMVKIIKAKKQEIFKEVEDKEKESVERLDKEQRVVENELQRIEKEIEKTETLFNRSANAEIVQLDMYTSSLESSSNAGEQVDCDFEDLGCLFFVDNKTLTEKVMSEGVGSVKTFVSKTKAQQSISEGKGISEATVGLEAKFVLTTRNAEGEQCYEEFDSVTMEIRNHQGDDCTTEVNVRDNKVGTYNISYFAKESGTCQASVMVNGKHVRGSPFTVQIKTRQYRSVLSFGQKGWSAGMFDKPWGVAANEGNEIAVTDRENNRVQVFNVDGIYLRSFGGEGQDDGEFDGPRGIVFLNNGSIIVTDSLNHRVEMFNGQGEYLSQFGGKGNLDHQLDFPWGLSVDSDGNIIVADSNHRLIKIFSPSGQLLRKFGGEDSLTVPRHCIQTGSNLIVSDVGDHCIKVFTGEGDFLYKFGKKGKGDGEFNRPRCLSVDKAGQLIVSEYGNDRIQVFDLSGKFITKFGECGSEIGEFNGPTSTAVLTDGRIVVCDRGNHRIQIFE